MYQFKWDHLDIKINNFFENVCKRVEELDPDLLALDTETTGLHIVKHSAFCISFGIANTVTKKAIAPKMNHHILFYEFACVNKSTVICSVNRWCNAIPFFKCFKLNKVC